MITSTSNPKVKELEGLVKKGKNRKLADVYIVEGIRMVREIPIRELKKVYVSEGFEKTHPELMQEGFGVPVEVLSDKVFKTVSDTQTPQGIMAIVRQKHYKLQDLLGQKKQPLFLVLESIQDPGNLGTMIRMAEGAGASGIIMNSQTADIYNPKVVRSTMGSIFRVPFFYTEDLMATLDILKAKGVKLYAAHLKGEHYYFQEDFSQATAIMIGNEAAGLSDEAAAAADTYIKIPMEGKVESLNAAMAATILMYEANRQRHS